MSDFRMDTSDAQRTRANRLYWESEARVDDIATEVGISRSSVYNAVEPLPAGIGCAACGDLTFFPNRTRRDAGEAVCSTCGVLTPVNAAAAASAPANGPERKPRETGTRLSGEKAAWVSPVEPPRDADPQRTALLGGAAVLGVVLGAAAVRVARGR